MSQRRACRVVGISDSVYRYQPGSHRNDAVIAKLQEAVERYPAYGFSKLFKILRRWGHGWKHKRVYRIYCELGLNRRRRRGLPNRTYRDEILNMYVFKTLNEVRTLTEN